RATSASSPSTIPAFISPCGGFASVASRTRPRRSIRTSPIGNASYFLRNFARALVGGSRLALGSRFAKGCVPRLVLSLAKSKRTGRLADRVRRGARCRQLQPRRGGDLASLADVSIKLIGGFAVFSDGEPLAEVRWRLRKGRPLGKLLALAPGHRLHREQLMDALWPDSDPAAAANNLNQVVHAARRVLGAEMIELSDQLLTLHAEVDVDDFERAAGHARRTGSPPAYRAALSLYAGELLPENRYDDWTLTRREQLEQLHDELEARLGAGRGDGRVFRLPPQARTFIGRESELSGLAWLLGGTRLLALAGAGGVGKTRLALELARRTDRPHTNEVAFVELASVGVEGLVDGAVASALDIGAPPGRTPLEAIVDYLAPRK